ncbi:MAG: hypothetical protein JJE21_00105 [Spirochaetaceae bacterium]|nr:hypothetical protein [Spirochaetaceae bacterium]
MNSIEDIAKYVTKAADEGDTLAIPILKDAGVALYDLVKSVVVQLPKNHEKKIVIAGGVIKNDKYVSKYFYELMRDNLSEYEIISNLINSAVDGALLLARTMDK